MTTLGDGSGTLANNAGECVTCKNAQVMQRALHCRLVLLVYIGHAARSLSMHHSSAPICPSQQDLSRSMILLVLFSGHIGTQPNQRECSAGPALPLLRNSIADDGCCLAACGLALARVQ